jgi:hypothetical protein
MLEIIFHFFGIHMIFLKAKQNANAKKVALPHCKYLLVVNMGEVLFSFV